MSNCFELLGLTPRAAMDDNLLEKAYLDAAKKLHPDHASGDSARTSALNEAISVLRSPSRRLKHLMELNSAVAWKAIPLEPSLMDLFAAVGRQLESAGKVTEKAKSVSTALSRALLSGEILKVRESLEDLNGEISSHVDSYLHELPGLDARIFQGDSTVWSDAQKLQVKLAYLEKWQTQIRERLFQLMI